MCACIFQAFTTVVICFLIGIVDVRQNVLAGSSSVKCGGQMKDHGTLHSPNYPKVYPNDAECEWNITVQEGYHIILNFTQFDLEGIIDCAYDYVEIKNGNKTVGRYCGKPKDIDGNAAPSKPIVSSENSVVVKFHSDYSNEKDFHGFEAHYAATDVNECEIKNGGCQHFCNNYIGGHSCSCRIGYLLAEDKKNCIYQCKNLGVRGTEGSVMSPEFPLNYPPYTDCDWTIDAEMGYSILLNFTTFDIEKHPDYPCPYDYLQIRDANSEERLCGNKKPKLFKSKSNWIRLEFHTDDSVNGRGFKVEYKLEGVSCPVVTSPHHGNMTGPTTFTFKDRLRFSCNDGYDLVGLREIQCNWDGNWDGPVPICKIRSCGKPPVPHGGMVSGTDYTYTSTIVYSCGVLYDLVGKNTSHCLANTSWSGEMPRCRPVCGRTKFPSERMKACRGRIVGGKEARKGSYPWLAAIWKHGKVVCGGSLINDEWVLTAAHCVTNAVNAVNDKNIFRISLGQHDIKKNDSVVQFFTVAEIIKHPEFTYASYNADVALMRLSKRTNITDYIRPVCLPYIQRHRHLFRHGRNTMVAGWGETALQRQSNKLNELCLPLVSKKACEDAFKEKGYTISEYMICAGKSKSRQNVCHGDSGGPLVAYDNTDKKWILGGVVSWGDTQSCGSTYEVFAKVTKIIKWIKRNAIFDLEDPFLDSD